MVKYSLSPKEILRAKPEGFPEGLGYISPYIFTRVTIQTFSRGHPTSVDLRYGEGDSISPSTLCLLPQRANLGHILFISLMYPRNRS